jgi:hypothetical protein
MSDITPPTTLDSVEDSLDTRFRDVFISYGRAESKAFATKLCEQLTKKGYTVWFDQNDIPLGVDFQHQIDDGIETAHNFIFVIAPHAVKSVYCRKEINLAIKRGKRIIPILHIEPTTKEIWDKMHPAIGKINWVYMRQKWASDKEQTQYKTIDDFDVGFNGVLSLLEQEKEYIRRHTQILFRAIEWEKNHYNSMHLLVANERKQAEEWLFQRFDKTQPPCLPSDLHARFISEAKKNANNLQTDVFIASAQKESTESIMTREQIIYRLSLYGYTSWTHVNDLNSSVDFNKAIKKGVEGADNLIFLITKESLTSEYCIEEVKYAISLNKRIIPLRLEEINESEFPAILKNIQYIDFTDNVKNTAVSKNDKTDFDKDIDDILQILQTDNEYLQRHKILLTQALKWERQDKNSSMLLRGHNLEQAKVWLKIGQKREGNIPLSIHKDFIRESQAKSSSERTDVFVSYSRTDGDIARKLNESLQIAGKTTWFDQESIASGADFQKEIYDGIQNADNIIFILSPESILSPYCADEVEFAQKLGKRFVTLLYREIDTNELHGALSAVQWIDFRTNTTKFERQFSEILRTLDTDREHVQAHTKWQNEAMEWTSFDKNSDFLLRGNELSLANEWMKEAKENQKIPRVTDLQEEFIKESLKQQKKVHLAVERNKQLGIATIAIIFAVAVLAGLQWYKSVQNQEQLAIKNLIFESKNIVDTNPDEAIQLAYAAYQARKSKDLTVVKNLYRHLENEKLIHQKKKFKVNNQIIDEYTPLFIELKANSEVLSVMASQDKSSFITIDIDSKLRLFDSKEGFVKDIEGQLPFYTQSSSESGLVLPSCLAISPTGRKIAAAIMTFQEKNEIILFDRNGRKLKSIVELNEDYGFEYALGFETFKEYPDSTFLIVSYKESSSDYYTVKNHSLVYTEHGEFVDTLSATGFGKVNETTLKANIENKIWNKQITKGKGAVAIQFNQTQVPDVLSSDYKLKPVDKKHALYYKDSLLETYHFPAEVLFSTLQTNDYLVVYDDFVASIIIFPNLIEPLLKEIKPLSAEEKIIHQIATLNDYREVPSEVNYMIAKSLSFLVVFLLSILILNYMNALFLVHKYFKMTIYLIVGLVIGLGWFLFIMQEEYTVRIAFSSSFVLSLVGIYYGKLDVKKYLYFNGFLYIIISILLFAGVIFIFHYATSEGLGTGITYLFGKLNWLLITVVVISWFAIEKASKGFSEHNFRYFSDWLGIIIFFNGIFLAASATNIFEDWVIGIFIIISLFPLTYFLRTLIHHSILHKYQKEPYSLTILRSYIPILIILAFLMIGIVIERGGQNKGSNYWLIVPIVVLFLYSVLFYIFTLFVSYKQKDKINLRVNIFFWWTLIIGFFSFAALLDSIQTETILFSQLIISFSIWTLPLFWWANKYRKNLKLKKQK